MLNNLKNIICLSILIIIIAIITACPTPQKYSEIPEIKFKQIILFDTIDDPDLQNPVKGYKLRFGLTDGDGNIGLNADDTIGIEIDSLYINNFFSILYEIKTADTIVVDSFKGYNFRIPYVQPQGQNKVLIADVFIDMTFAYHQDTLTYDSVMFEFYIIDRDLNKSNTEKTLAIKLDTIGIFPPVLEE